MQLDSNTVVPNFDELYSKTFGATIQKDGLNASFYDDFYISAHNKMVYTTPTGLLATNGQLEKRLKEWCKDHQNNDEDKRKNSIYAKVFTRALYDVEYVKEFMIKVNNENKSIYPATLDEKVYWLTTCMTTSVNMSWKPGDTSNMNQDLLKFPPVLMDKDGLFDFPCLLNVIKKHTRDLVIHSKALKLNDSSPYGDVSRELLLKLSNNEIELRAAKEFMLNIMQSGSSSLMNGLSNLFFNTNHFNALTNTLFNCTVGELKERLNKNIANEAASPRNNEEKITPRP